MKTEIKQNNNTCTKQNIKGKPTKQGKQNKPNPTKQVKSKQKTNSKTKQNKIRQIITNKQ